MKPRWLLLAVGVVCLLVLAPAAALSQEGTEIACGSAVIDGTVGTAEWADATRLPMSGYYEGDGDSLQTHGWLYLKNDERYLYVGATMDIGDEDPEYWDTILDLAFTDEPCGDPDAWVDDEWEASDCDESPGEGWFSAYEHHYGLDHETGGPTFDADSEDASWCDEEPAQGVIAKAGRHTAHYEMRIDLTSSELNCVGAGDCFRFHAFQNEQFCPADNPECPDGEWMAGWVESPPFDYWSGPGAAPDDFGTICLNPCEVEFVPEAATMLLLGSGLASLAGYAGLRWRARS